MAVNGIAHAVVCNGMGRVACVSDGKASRIVVGTLGVLGAMGAVVFVADGDSATPFPVLG